MVITDTVMVTTDITMVKNTVTVMAIITGTKSNV
jgi:hypothetical protein